MDELAYWRKQQKTVLFTGIDSERPEQSRQAGKVLLVGGQRSAFFAVADVAKEANELGVGEIKILLPDSLKSKVPSGAKVVFAPSDGSGGFGKAALALAKSAAEEVDYILVVGDLGKNSETATFVNRLISETKKAILVMRDTVDLIAPDAGDWLLRNKLMLYATLPQLQKIFRTVFYPKMITLSMPTNQLIETLHKFTITYPVLVVTYHNGQIIVAQKGEVVTTDSNNTKYTAINFWSGELAAQMAALQVWNSNRDFEAAITAILV